MAVRGFSREPCSILVRRLNKTRGIFGVRKKCLTFIFIQGKIMSYFDKILANQNLPYFIQEKEEREETEKEDKSDS